MSTTCKNCQFDDCYDSDRYCIKCGHRLARASSFYEANTATKRVYDSTVVHVRLGLVYLQNGKQEKALASWKTALQLDPDNKEAKSLLQKYSGHREHATNDDLKAAK